MNKLEPRIRFERANQNWEQIRFKDFVYKISKKNSDKSLPRVEFEDVKSGSGYLINNIYEKNNKHKSGTLFKKNDILFGKLRPYLKNFYISKFTGIAVGDFWVLRAKEDYSYKFIYSLIQTNKYNYIANISTGTKMPRSDWGLVSNSYFPVPKFNEQEKIGRFFEKLDDLIQNQESYLDLNKKLKKSLLQKLFPKEGKDRPELRFTGFNDKWKKEYFKNIVSLSRGLTYKPSDVRDYGVRVLRSSNIDRDKFILNNDDVFVNYKAVNTEFISNDDILITSANGSPNLIGKHAIVKLEKNDKMVAGGFMISGTTKNSYFINSSMSTIWYKKFIHTHITGGNGAIGNLKKEDLNDQIISIPNNQEQEKIGSLFKSLDEKIEAEEKKLKAYKDFKKSMLQKMFV